MCSSPSIAEKWTPGELRAAVQSRTQVQTVYGQGKILQIRPDRSVVVELSYGKAYLSLDALSPPTRFAPDSRVKTPFGKGKIVSLKPTPDTIIYEVELIEWKLSSGLFARAFLQPDSVSTRAVLTPQEIIQALDEMKARGNEQFKRKDFKQAVKTYMMAIEQLQRYSQTNFSESERATSINILVTIMSNLCLGISKLDTVSHEGIIYYATQGLTLDPTNRSGKMSKLLFRRAQALQAKNEYDAAYKDYTAREVLADSAFASKAKAAAKVCVARKKAQQRKTDNLFKNAFSLKKSQDAMVAEGATPEDAEQAVEAMQQMKRTLKSSKNVAVYDVEDIDEEDEYSGASNAAWKWAVGAACAGALGIALVRWLRLR